MSIAWADSASRHNIDRADALHAVSNAQWHVSDFDEPRVPGGTRPHAWVGPTRDGTSIEVFAEVHPGPHVFIFHVMPTRPKTLRRLTQIMKARTTP